MPETFTKEQLLNDASDSRHNSNASQAKHNEAGRLFIVATPIGNLQDVSQRALTVLADVDLILAEDTRHSRRLLSSYGISTRLKAFHEHNETAQIDWVKTQLEKGEDLALISDAGTPLISDPGFGLVRELRASHYEVLCLPGPSSVIAALSVAGLPTDRFIFDGFLPAKREARRKQYAEYLTQPRTVVLFESSHRILASLEDLVGILGADRQIAMARELTKRYETVMTGTAGDILAKVREDSDQTRGEFVLVLEGVKIRSASNDDLTRLLTILLEELSVKQAAALAAKLIGVRKNEAYEAALQLQVTR